ncbi:MAG: hypothetical protein UZ22_OP11002000804 [Microgenomates bacterium OLB23]|nr:MAG: hypothetical protein UZ22_OP11002000804 [Microgenomates bacterium OLB23]
MIIAVTFNKVGIEWKGDFALMSGDQALELFSRLYPKASPGYDAGTGKIILDEAHLVLCQTHGYHPTLEIGHDEQTVIMRYSEQDGRLVIATLKEDIAWLDGLTSKSRSSKVTRSAIAAGSS